MSTTTTNEAGHGLPEVAAAREVIRAYFAGELDDTMILNLSESLALSRGVPADMVLVPREPTPEMLRAGFLSESEGFGIETPADAPSLVYRAMLAAAPAAAGAQGEEYAACCDTPTYCSSVRRCTRMDSTPQPAAADGGVRERARELLAQQYEHYGYFDAATNIREAGGGYALSLRALESAISSHRQAGEPNGKLVGWWNGIMPDVTERSPYGPSVRWGADAENSGHDIPLYDGYNPIHYTTPPLSKFRELAEGWTQHGEALHANGFDIRGAAMHKCARELLALVEKGAGNG